MIINNEKTKKSRLTKQRSALLSLLRSTKEHPSALWLYERMRETFPAISLGTVYRNLTVLADQGQIAILHGGGFDRFDGDTSIHSHVTCTVCGSVRDVTADIPPEAMSEKSAENESGYKIFSHRLNFYGICPECLRNQEAAGKNGCA